MCKRVHVPLPRPATKGSLKSKTQTTNPLSTQFTMTTLHALAQRHIPQITHLPDDTEETLHERIKVQERRLLVQTIASLAESHGAESRGTASDS